MADIRESLNDQIFISSFTDPASAVEATQGAQTYPFKQSKDIYFDNEDEAWLLPPTVIPIVPSNPVGTSSYVSRALSSRGTGGGGVGIGQLIYKSVDGMNWELQPSTLTDVIDKVVDVIDSTNWFSPISRDSYKQNLALPPLNTIQTDVRKLSVSVWDDLKQGKYKRMRNPGPFTHR
jgi:hypothetical protein